MRRAGCRPEDLTGPGRGSAGGPAAACVNTMCRTLQKIRFVHKFNEIYMARGGRWEYNLFKSF